MKEPIIIGISTSGINLTNLCVERKIEAKYLVLEQRSDKWINKTNALRGFVNPDSNGEFDISAFEDVVAKWLDSIFGNKAEIGTVIIVNCIGGVYGTMAGRGFFNQLQKLEIDVHWVFSQPYCSSENERIKIAYQFTEDILSLPNVYVHKYDIGNCNSLPEAEVYKIVNNYMITDVQKIISC